MTNIIGDVPLQLDCKILTVLKHRVLVVRFRIDVQHVNLIPICPNPNLRNVRD